MNTNNSMNTTERPTIASTEPLHASTLISVDGQVQGVGFRPFIYRLAHELGIAGWVQNRLGQVSILVQGSDALIQEFSDRIMREAPVLARPAALRQSRTRHERLHGFSILASAPDSTVKIHIPPDYPVCDDCQRELLDPMDRRYHYPFINCTQCGPRYTLIDGLPYDRSNTTMAAFPLCNSCRAEYLDPGNRRFHAEPVACTDCGPQLWFSDQDYSTGDTPQALQRCVAALHAGMIIAVKALGGYHLMCDAGNDAAVSRLRQRKQRPAKPLALLCADVTSAAQYVCLDAHGLACLQSPIRPIVMATKRGDSDCGVALSPQIAPGLNQLGVMLPSNPLQILLLQQFQGPLVATSANHSGEPVLTADDAVQTGLRHVIDGILRHNRLIRRPADDSVYRVIARKARPVRIGRGLAPLELALPFTLPYPILAAGAHMKNTVALAWDERIVISPHIGDLEAPRTLAIHAQTIADLQTLYQVEAQAVIADCHTGYGYNAWLDGLTVPVYRVPHHYAHASALAAEQWQQQPWLVFTWDGTGLGVDQTLWGGETLYGSPGSWQRVASLRPFRLPGGDRVIMEPWRLACSLCWESGGDHPMPASLHDEERLLLRKSWEQGLNAPWSSAVGRLFDAAAVLCGCLQQASYEAEAPLRLETLAQGADPGIQVPLPMLKMADGIWRSDWEPLLTLLRNPSYPEALRARAFHDALAANILEQATRLRAELGPFTVGLCGGVFQNRLLTETALELLHANGFDVFIPEQLPCNDAALSYGQVIEALHCGILPRIL